MSSPTFSYDIKATQSLRASLGGYPSLKSLPGGMSDSDRIIKQTDAADRAFLRAGMSLDGAHTKQVAGFHPLLHAFNKSIKTTAERKAWVTALKQDLWDAATALDRLTGGATVIIHSSGDMPPRIINRGENSFANVYFTPRWLQEMPSQFEGPLSRMVNEFIFNVQVPVVERRRDILYETSGVVNRADANVKNHTHIPQNPVPFQMREHGHATSPWRGRPKASIPALKLEGVVGSRLSTTPLPFTYTVLPLPDSESAVSPTDGDDTWFGSNEVLPAVTKASPKSHSSAATPPVTPVVGSSVVNTIHPPPEPAVSPTDGDDTWFVSDDVLDAVDYASAEYGHEQKMKPAVLPTDGDDTWFASSGVLSTAENTSARYVHEPKPRLYPSLPASPRCTPRPLTSSHTALLAVQEPPTHSTLLSCQPIGSQPLNLSDSDDDGSPPSSPLQTSALNKFARPRPHTRQPLQDQRPGMPSIKLPVLFDTGAATRNTNLAGTRSAIRLPDNTISISGLSLGAATASISVAPSGIFPAPTDYSGANVPCSTGSSISSVSSIKTSASASAAYASLRSPLSAYGKFNPIIPPGPHTEHWLIEHGWPPRWANILRKVAEENTSGRWIDVLVDEYQVEREAAEALKACIMDDFVLQSRPSEDFDLFSHVFT